MLRQLLVGRLVCTPRQLPAGRFYEFSGTATYGELLAGVVGGLVPPGESEDLYTVQVSGMVRAA